MQTPNRLHVMMASNERWVVAASMNSRRYFVLEVSDARKGDFPYFDAIVKQMQAGGGYEAMPHDLLTRDISAFNVRDVPTTEGLQRQRSLSLSLPTTEAEAGLPPPKWSQTATAALNCTVNEKLAALTYA